MLHLCFLRSMFTDVIHILLISSTSHRQSGSLEAKSAIRAAAAGSVEAAGQISQNHPAEPNSLNRADNTTTAAPRPKPVFIRRTDGDLRPPLLLLLLLCVSSPFHTTNERGTKTPKKKKKLLFDSRFLPAAAKRTHTNRPAAPMNKIRTRNTISRAHSRNRSRQG